MSIEIGAKYGRLVVLAQHGSDGHNKLWRCRCECGGDKVASTPVLRRGFVQSCGCLQAEVRAQKARKHGQHGSPTYRIWKAMLNRCRLVDYPQHRNHAGKGINVCERWCAFENFLADMGERPPGLTLDRIDNEGNYEPGNCRWATWSQQRCNSSQTTHRITYAGETRTIAEWAERLKLNPKTIYARYRHGLPIERVLAARDLRL